jgi:hypothetical protein
MKKISTSALAKKLNIQPKELFNKLFDLGYIERDGEYWKITKKGQEVGAEYKESQQYGQYIIWREDSNLFDRMDIEKLITATEIGKAFNTSANKINFILSQLGWVTKHLKGWLITEQGKKQNGVQTEDNKSGVPYVKWSKSIIDNKTLQETMKMISGNDSQEKKEVGFREKFEAKHRAADGHFVRSKAEMLIDNWLYMAEITHAYERKLPIEEDVYCDFYVPAGKVYIEYWGYEEDMKYLDRKKQKIEIYKKYNFRLIELTDKEVQNLDDVLPKMLLKFGVQAY